ncbi:MAG: FecR family protein [Deltaproteobacteria bacterium]|nr:FecR family protein [Deltaproteobacteria bacterium]
MTLRQDWNHNSFSRRRLLQWAGGTAVALVTSRILNSLPAWAGKRGPMVLSLQGDAYLGGKPLKKGMSLPTGLEIQAGKQSTLVVSLEDGSLLRLSQGARMVFGDPMESLRRDIRLAAGHLLAVFRPGGQYRLQGKTVTVGVKGTVLFHAILDRDDQKQSFPAKTQEYVCLCNGHVGLENAQAKSLGDWQTEYHHPGFFGTAGEISGKGFLFGHSDPEIRALMALGEPDLHPKGWLKH